MKRPQQPPPRHVTVLYGLHLSQPIRLPCELPRDPLFMTVDYGRHHRVRWHEQGTRIVAKYAYRIEFGVSSSSPLQASEAFALRSSPGGPEHVSHTDHEFASTSAAFPVTGAPSSSQFRSHVREDERRKFVEFVQTLEPHVCAVQLPTCVLQQTLAYRQLHIV